MLKVLATAMTAPTAPGDVEPSTPHDRSRAVHVVQESGEARGAQAFERHMRTAQSAHFPTALTISTQPGWIVRKER